MLFIEKLSSVSPWKRSLSLKEAGVIRRKAATLIMSVIRPYPIPTSSLIRRVVTVEVIPTPAYVAILL